MKSLNREIKTKNKTEILELKKITESFSTEILSWPNMRKFDNRWIAMIKSKHQIEITEVKGHILGPLRMMSRIQHRCKERPGRSHEKGTEKQRGS